MITFSELENHANPFACFVRETFGAGRRGSVEGLNYHNDTVSVYFWREDEQVDIHLKGLVIDDQPAWFQG